MRFFEFLAKISIFDQNYVFLSKFQLLDKHAIFWPQLPFLIKMSIFGQTCNFWSKFRFFGQLAIFCHNFDFRRNFWFSTKISIFCANLRFMLKFSTKNRTNAPFSDVTLFRYTVYVTIKVIAAAKRLRLPEVVIFIFRLSPESRSLSHQML